MKVAYVICALWLSASLMPLRAQVPALPLRVSDADWQPLREQVDPVLQRRLETSLTSRTNWRPLIRNRKMAVAVVDLSRPDAVRFANVNGDVMIYAASLPKIGILLAVEQGFEDGTIEETPEVLNDLNDMIRYSSNEAATRMYDLAGFERIRDVLTDPRYALFDTSNGGGLWVGKPYAQEGERHPDPLAGLSHGATVNQVSRFYYLLAEGRLINAARSRQMLDIMASPGINHKFVYSLRTRAPRARLFRKSGSWRNWHADSILVWGPEWRRYIVVCLVEDTHGERILRDLIPVIEQILNPSTSSAASIQ